MRGRANPRAPARAVVTCLAATGLLALSLLVVPAMVPATAGASPATAGGPLTQSNGVVRLVFPQSRPAFSLSSVANSSSTVGQALTGLAEISPKGSILSFASFLANRVAWTVTPGSGPSGLNVSLNATVGVVASGGEWESGDDSSGSNATIGEANVTVSFSLNASGARDPWSVGYSLNVSGWPWLRPADTLGVEVRSNQTASPGYWVASGADALLEISRGSGTPLAWFVWGTTARASYAAGSSQDSSIGAYHNLTSGGMSYLVRLQFTSVRGGYSSLSYDPWLGLIAPSGPVGRAAAWILTPTGLEAILGGGAVSLVLAAVARTRRVPPEADL